MDTKYFSVVFAKDGDRTTVPDPAQMDGTLSFDIGYGVDYALDPMADPDAILIERRKFNYLLYAITSSLAALQTDFPQWVSSADNDGAPFAYKNGAVVRYTVDGNLWQSIQAANTATPGSDITKWILFGSQWALTAALTAEVTRALAAEALLAPKASPAFTGTPTAPTAPPGTSNGILASCAFVAGAVAYETARASAAEALLAPKASPVFTGAPAAPTAPAGTNSTTLATTQYADRAVAAETFRAMGAEALLAPNNSPGLTGTPTTPTPPGGSNDGTIPNTSWVRALLGGNFAPSVPGYFQYGAFLIQWVVGPYDPGDSSEPNYTLPWATPFPSACLAAVASCDLLGHTGSQDCWYQTYGWNSAGVNIQRQRPAAGAFTTPTRAVAFGIGF